MNAELLETAKKILEANPSFALSGSLALNLQGIKTRREPKDIDLYSPLMSSGIVWIEGMEHDGYAASLGEQYDNEYYSVNPYKINGVSVDIFERIDNDVPDLIMVTKGGIRCVAFFEIMKLKISHAYGKHFSKFKHKDDIAFMMSNIS